MFIELCAWIFKLGCMSSFPEAESPLDKLWEEYTHVFKDFDDLTLARWMSQTLGQLEGHAWRMSHPLVGAYRLAARQAHERQVWFKRLATIPAAYGEASCCGAPMLPLITRDVADGGLVCQHCGEICLEFDSFPEELKGEIKDWAEAYRTVHAVAHWDDRQRQSTPNYDDALEEAARDAERLLARVGGHIIPQWLDHYPAMVWEDQDECLEVRPEDIQWKGNA